MATRAGDFVTYLGMLALVCFSTGTRVRILIQSTQGWHHEEVDEGECLEGLPSEGKDILNATVRAGANCGTVASITIHEGQEPRIRLHLPGWRLSGEIPLSRISSIKFR